MYTQLSKVFYKTMWNNGRSFFDRNTNPLIFIIKIKNEEEAYIIASLFMSAINNTFVSHHSFLDREDMVLHLKGPSYKKTKIEQTFDYLFHHKDITTITHNQNGVELFKSNKIGFI